MEHSNAMAMLYSGSLALCKEKTCYGKCRDGIVWLSRYFVDNFYAGYSQDCVELLTLQLDPHKVKDHSMQNFKLMIFTTLLFAFVVWYLTGFGWWAIALTVVLGLSTICY